MLSTEQTQTPHPTELLNAPASGAHDGMSGSLPSRDSTYYLETIFFQAEDTIFQVPKYHFARNEGIFEAVFSLDPGAGNSPDGSSEEKPFRIEGIAASEFRSLFKVLYPLQIPADYSDLDLEEWTNVLKLSTMWDFTAVRKLAIATLSSDNKLTPVQMIKYGKEHHVPKWVREGAVKMANRHQGPNLEEGRYLGADLTVQIYRVREERLQWEKRGFVNGSAPGVFKTDAAVAREFEEELNFDPTA